MKSLLKSSLFWFAFSAFLLLGAGLFVTWLQWDWLRGGGPEAASNGDTLRNAGLMLGGIIALVFALWRGWVAQQQLTAAQRQADISQQGMLNERYERGAEMLGSDVLSVRLGGIYALRRLAEEHPEQYHIQIMELLCAFVRNPVENTGKRELKSIEESPPHGMSGFLREDVQAVITAIGARSGECLMIERTFNFRLDLRGANLSFGRFSGANLANGDLTDAVLIQANFFDMTPSGPDLSTPMPSGPNQPQAAVEIPGSFVPLDFSGVEGRRANLSSSILKGADLSDAFLFGADLSGAQLMDANLSRSHLTKANLYKAVLLGANLSEAFLLGADLSGAQLASGTLVGTLFPDTKLYGANFFMAKLDGADFSGAVLSKEEGKYVATGLTQAQLDRAKVNPSNPPDLTGVVEVGSGRPLKWSESSFNNRA